jgi:hypothetical protein
VKATSPLPSRFLHDRQSAKEVQIDSAVSTNRYKRREKITKDSDAAPPSLRICRRGRAVNERNREGEAWRSRNGRVEMRKGKEGKVEKEEEENAQHSSPPSLYTSRSLTTEDGVPALAIDDNGVPTLAVTP